LPFLSPIDIASTSGQATFSHALTVGTPVKVYGIPRSDGTMQAYVVTYFTGTMPSM
jgi:hypothetical protein